MTTTTPTVAVVGGGLAGATTAEALRSLGFDGPVTIYADEPHRPYERPVLSKAHLLTGKADDDELFVHPAGWYAEHDVELRTGCPVQAVDLTDRRLTLSDGDRPPFDLLVLATGSSPRRLHVPGAGLSGVHHLRTLDDSRALHAALVGRPRVVVIGGGWIGLEVAAAATTLGASVTVLEAGPLPMGALLGTRVANLLLDAHRSRGVRFRTGVGVDRLVGDAHDRVVAVRLVDGTTLPADLVVVGIGAVPGVALAEQAGVAVDNGVLVDEHLRASRPDVFAAGDVANAWHPTLGVRVRVEHWATALNQPRTVAATITGQHAPYDALPYFFSDQYDVGLEYTGRTDPRLPSEVVVRGDAGAGSYTAFWLQEARVVAAMSVNTWGQTDTLEALIRARRPVPTTALADEHVPLESLVGVPAEATG